MHYIEEANQTKSDQFHGELVPHTAMLMVLQNCIGNLQQLDKIKKALFYGRKIALTELAPFADADGDCEIMPNLVAKSRADGVDLIHGIIGKATEAGELLEALLACWSDIEAGGIDRTNLMEELGDGQWYDAILAKALGFTFEEVQQINIAKLRARFPNRFTEYDAENRDLAAERQILESAKPE